MIVQLLNHYVVGLRCLALKAARSLAKGHHPKIVTPNKRWQ
jgi:hypothetical protein